MEEKIFEINLDLNRTVYMKGKSTEHYEIVLVDAKKFLNNANIDSRCSNILGDNVSGHYYKWKYRFAEAGFFYGIKNPVPSGNLNYFLKNEPFKTEKKCKEVILDFFLKRKRQVKANQNLVCGFGDGATRTHFLLLNEAEYFPILCDRTSAENFRSDFGYNGKVELLDGCYKIVRK
ncbi:MAG: hypothetical protein AB7U85_04990 [Alphaproteobacteria bacterium]